MAVGDVLLQARINQWDAQTRLGRQMNVLRLTDSGDRVLWHDRDGDQEWRLPDQQSSSPDLPVLTTVVLATAYPSAIGNRPEVKMPFQVLFLQAADGVSLATLMTASVMDVTYAAEEDLERIWPRNAFAALEARGVPFVEEEYDTFDALNRAHPGAATGVRVGLMTRRFEKWELAVFAVVLTVVVGALIANWLSSK
jgi:hypothetical protein